MNTYEDAYDKWLDHQIRTEKSARRRELLQRGLGHGTVELLRSIWYPTIGNLDHLHAEFEVRDYNNGCRYLDLAYMPGSKKGCVEIHGFRSHARDIEASRFKDLCMKQALLALDDWLFLPIAYLSIEEDAGVVKQLVLSFVGKFLSTTVNSELTWAEAETIRFARTRMKPFTPKELSAHLQLSEHRTRVVLRSLIDKRLLLVASGTQRYRTFRLA
ncbi:transcriptional regulator [Paenibacillus sp. J5C_2022]|uniref:transcriptional regulator n=1 Tax=Paenibacillus sp. J5C2022 TaxID=2977129 RepID=UPI0021CE10A1|nr:transcriptional regulator [Paenibacillus sp. J5C2022]MCU6709991.1 transcriptional regulator [Paenibacillus sp. J5C2022]